MFIVVAYKLITTTNCNYLAYIPLWK